ncbi:MAG TPA: ATP-binding protein [Opitutaceae bacterium]
MQLFAFNLAFLLLALVFASRRLAFAMLVVIVASHIGFHRLAFTGAPIGGSTAFAASALLRDGLIAIAFVFILGMTLMLMVDAAQGRSEAALRATLASNENLERLVSERTRELEEASARANDAARAKGDFLANMSHEIRTPLNGIIASSELLCHRDDLPPAASAHARLISDSGELLLRLLNDILDFSKIEAGQLALENHPFALALMVEDSLALMAANAAQGGVRLDCTIGPGLPAHVEGDSFRLRQILLNLLSNAVKFTPPGGQVRLTVACGPTQDGVAPVIFEVSDTGIGMDAATLKRIFQRFTQADSSTTRRYGGTGLGLAITSRLTEMMAGRIEVRSAPGEGSVFCCRVPLRVVEETPVPAGESKDRIQNLGLAVLVVEDNPVNRKVLGAQLDQLGCRHTMVVNGAEALSALQEEPLPDVVLMDCHMPGLDGWEATRRLRAWSGEPDAPPSRRRAAALPVIALTAAVLPGERRNCIESGMNAVIGKPIKLTDLQSALQSFVRAPRRADTAGV